MTPTQAILDAIPFNKTLGIEVLAFTGTSVEMRLAFRPDLANHIGTMHAVAQFGLGEAACGMLAMLIFQDQLTTVVPLNKASQIDYRHPSHGTLIARGEIAPEAVALAREAFARDKKAAFSTAVVLYDEDDPATVVTTVTVEWVVFPRR